MGEVRAAWVGIVDIDGVRNAGSRDWWGRGSSMEDERSIRDDGPVSSPRQEDEVFRSSAPIRTSFVLLGLVGAGLFLVKYVASGDVVFAAFVPLCIPVVLEGLRSRVVVRVGSGEVVSTRAFLTRRCRAEDITSIWVPAWGPVGLILRAPADPLRAQADRLITGLYTTKASASETYRLAALLGVPLRSSWQGIEWTPPNEAGDARP